ncbi:MAG: hypothetical protein NTY05_11755 [Rhodocyclales bacterium]|nr:hypothetical protein [Rhodocyclales bacterium]
MMPARVLSIVCVALVLAGARTTFAQPVVAGSTAFCLYEIPAEESGKRRWINLGIVQYVEAARTEVKISYGGGAFGSGYDVRIPVTSMDEALTTLEKMRKAAAACR